MPALRRPSIGGPTQGAQSGVREAFPQRAVACRGQPWTSRPQGAMTRAMNFMLRFFTWWNGWTYGTQVWTSLYGELVGEDEFGNRYYRTRGGKIDPTLGFERRWVIYNG